MTILSETPFKIVQCPRCNAILMDGEWRKFPELHIAVKEVVKCFCDECAKGNKAKKMTGN